MSVAGAIPSVEAMLAHPAVRECGIIELSVCDAVHFRLLRAKSIFELAELQLCARNAALFSGFAECRAAVEQTSRGSPLETRIAACCTRRPDWLDDREVLHSTELAVWMETSYPNPWALQLYHAALLAGKAISIPRIGPFPEAFHRLLLEKNGFELTARPQPQDKVVRVHIGEQSYLPEPCLHLVTPALKVRPHPFARDERLACQMANGLMEMHLEDCSARRLDCATFRTRLFGHRFIGPALVCFLQSLNGKDGPVAFTGPGAEVLYSLADALQAAWPWFPRVSSPLQTHVSFNLLDELLQVLAPLPGHPEGLYLPALRFFLTAAFGGDCSEKIQEAAAHFVREYAQMTRGFDLVLPRGPVVDYWVRNLLAPDAGFLAWALAPGCLPGLQTGIRPWRMANALRTGPWPTGTWIGAGWLARRLGRWRAKPLVQAIEAAQTDYA